MTEDGHISNLKLCVGLEEKLNISILGTGLKEIRKKMLKNIEILSEVLKIYKDNKELV